MSDLFAAVTLGGATLADVALAPTSTGISAALAAGGVSAAAHSPCINAVVICMPDPAASGIARNISSGDKCCWCCNKAKQSDDSGDNCSAAT